MRGTNGILPNCEYCGQFVNPKNEGVKAWPIYGFMCVEREAYAHGDCHTKHLRKRQLESAWVSNVCRILGLSNDEANKALNKIRPYG